MLQTSGGLKYGYSSGSCAAAAIRGALLMLQQQHQVDFVALETPGQIKLSLPLTDQKWGENWASCAVVKDSGDDPDITNGIKIHAHVTWHNCTDYILEAGEGIGRVTKPGLQIPPGEPAINPIPRQMIAQQVKELVPPERGVKITLSAPAGKELACRTFNPRLGIVGGISILGTTGLVEPKSINAFKTSLVLALDVAKASGKTELVLVPGYLGERFALEHLNIDADNIVQMGNLVGFMLEKASQREFKKITLVGHIGKLVKVAAGHFDTSSAIVDNRLETIGKYAKVEGAQPDLLMQLLALPTAEASVALLEENNLMSTFEKIAHSASQYASCHIHNKAIVDCYIYSFGKGLIGRSIN